MKAFIVSRVILNFLVHCIHQYRVTFYKVYLATKSEGVEKQKSLYHQWKDHQLLFFAIC